MAQLPNTTKATLESLTCFTTGILIKGLYFDYKGEKRTPARIYFSMDLREWRNDPQAYGGKAYCHFDNALRPVFLPGGKQLCVDCMRGVSADYDNTLIKNFSIA